MNPIPVHGRVPSLDGWRAVAILLVLGDHFEFTSSFPKDQFGWMPWVFDGDLGVRIFFVLSGFLISLLLIREADQHHAVSLKDFYLRRIFRIFPVYFSYIAVLGVLALIHLYHDNLTCWIGALTFTRNFIGGGAGGTAHFWSLAVEEQFYLLWPILFVVFRLWTRPKFYFGLLLVPIVVCPLLRACVASHNHGHTLGEIITAPRSIVIYADSLAVGCIGAWLASRIPVGGAWKSQYHVLIIVALLVLAGGRWAQLTLDMQSRALDAVIPSIQAWFVLALLWLTASPSALGHYLLNSATMRGLGVLSYSIYIWHFMFLSYFMGGSFQNWPTHDWRLWVIPSIATAAVSYLFLETPFIALRRKFQHQT